jgi:hypothetical protein
MGGMECPISWGPWYNQGCGHLTCTHLVDKRLFYTACLSRLVSMVLVVVRVFLSVEVLELVTEGEGGLSFFL